MFKCQETTHVSSAGCRCRLFCLEENNANLSDTLRIQWLFLTKKSSTFFLPIAHSACFRLVVNWHGDGPCPHPPWPGDGPQQAAHVTLGSQQQPQPRDPPKAGFLFMADSLRPGKSRKKSFGSQKGQGIKSPICFIPSFWFLTNRVWNSGTEPTFFFSISETELTADPLE